MFLDFRHGLLKVTRAKVHLDCLRREIYDFCQTKPYSLIGEEDPENALYRVRVKFAETPASISLIAGDFFFCLRCGLDQIVSSLAKLMLQHPKQTQFPVIDVLNAESKKRFTRQTTGVPAEAVAVIESLQPYHGADRQAVESHLLWKLNALCNIDKHRRIPVFGTVSDFHDVFPNWLAASVRFNNNDKVDELLVPLEHKGQINLNARTTVHVLFGDGREGVVCDYVEIGRIYKFVGENVLPQFARFFG